MGGSQTSSPGPEAGAQDAGGEWRPAGYGEPLLVVLSGPSGVGKTSVIRRMQELGLPYHIGVTATTRPPRPHEVEGVDYYFVTRPRFEQMIADGELLEWAEVHGTHLYGIPRRPIREALARGLDVIVPPEPQGAATLRAAVPGVVTIFLAAPSFDDLQERIRARRSESEAEIERRLQTARAELARVHEFQYLVINEDGRLDETVRQIDTIIRAEKLRVRATPITM